MRTCRPGFAPVVTHDSRGAGTTGAIPSASAIASAVMDEAERRNLYPTAEAPEATEVPFGAPALGAVEAAALAEAQKLDAELKAIGEGVAPTAPVPAPASAPPVAPT